MATLLNKKESGILASALNNYLSRQPIFCSPLSKAFLSFENLYFCKKKIESILKINFEVTEEFIESAIQILLVNSALSYSQDGVTLLNLKLINETVRYQGIKLSQRRLYQKYFLQLSRLNAFPRPILTRPGKGEFPGVDISTYTLSSPLNRFRDSILMRTLGRTKADGSVVFHLYSNGAGCQYYQKPPTGNLWE